MQKEQQPTGLTKKEVLRFAGGLLAGIVLAGAGVINLEKTKSTIDGEFKNALPSIGLTNQEYDQALNYVNANLYNRPWLLVGKVPFRTSLLKPKAVLNLPENKRNLDLVTSAKKLKEEISSQAKFSSQKTISLIEMLSGLSVILSSVYFTVFPIKEPMSRWIRKPKKSL